jgi:hypothetical protein
MFGPKNLLALLTATATLSTTAFDLPKRWHSHGTTLIAQRPTGWCGSVRIDTNTGLCGRLIRYVRSSMREWCDLRCRNAFTCPVQPLLLLSLAWQIARRAAAGIRTWSLTVRLVRQFAAEMRESVQNMFYIDARIANTLPCASLPLTYLRLSNSRSRPATLSVSWFPTPSYERSNVRSCSLSLRESVMLTKA